MPGIALVTGANKGIGLEIVRQLAASQWWVFLTGRSLSSITQAASTLSPSVTPVVLDVTSSNSIEAAVKTLSQAVDHLDVLINNAGILDDEDGSIFDLPAERLRRMFETNTILSGRCVLPRPFCRCSGRVRPPGSSMSRAGPDNSPTW